MTLGAAFFGRRLGEVQRLGHGTRGEICKRTISTRGPHRKLFAATGGVTDVGLPSATWLATCHPDHPWTCLLGSRQHVPRPPPLDTGSDCMHALSPCSWSCRDRPPVSNSAGLPRDRHDQRVPAGVVKSAALVFNAPTSVGTGCPPSASPPRPWSPWRRLSVARMPSPREAAHALVRLLWQNALEPSLTTTSPLTIAYMRTTPSAAKRGSRQRGQPTRP